MRVGLPHDRLDFDAFPDGWLFERFLCRRHLLIDPTHNADGYIFYGSFTTNGDHLSPSALTQLATQLG